ERLAGRRAAAGVGVVAHTRDPRPGRLRVGQRAAGDEKNEHGQHMDKQLSLVHGKPPLALVQGPRDVSQQPTLRPTTGPVNRLGNRAGFGRRWHFNEVSALYSRPSWGFRYEAPAP